ncbi:hypothetical protein BYT27DRAFT_7258593 [Phlegmacium glaucopus]|nr:hypothetical protein BYT27DRAFT_7258593 [Phlegmacium glaucopus]
MGRRKLYSTPEEKLAANRAKSKRHYDRAKEGINERQRKTYQKQTLKHKQSGIVNKSSSGKPDVAKSALDIWNKQVEQVNARFSRYIGHHEDLTSFIEAICTKFIENQDVDKVLQHTVALGVFQKSLYRSQAGILELDGIRESWSQADKVVRKVSKTLA